MEGPTVRKIASHSHPYTVEEFASVDAAIVAVQEGESPHFVVDRTVHELFSATLGRHLPPERLHLIEASEETKSYRAIEPLFLELLENGLRRSGSLVVVGGGVAQDVGCFIASLVARGIRWSFLPTTLLAQADSCIGSKSSINIGVYKNQLGTFYPPHRVLLVPSFLETLPADEMRSGLGEVIKLQLLSSGVGFRELMSDLSDLWSSCPSDRLGMLARWVQRSMDVKQPIIEADEFDRDQRLLLNYGHTFGHAFESTTRYAIPHGIAVILGVLTATAVSVQLGRATPEHGRELMRLLRPWHEPHAGALKSVSMEDMLKALARDKKNAATGLTCILTRGVGCMERVSLTPEQVRSVVVPTLARLIENGFTD